jgi:UDP-glucose-4-epimerase GalE
MTDKWVAITGCNGYIGGQTALRFKDLGYKVLGVDRNATAPWITEQLDQVIKGDFNNAMFINSFIDKNPVALIHIAGTSLVGPSMTDPGPYYANNVGNTAKLLASLAERGWRKTVVFSSSAAVYGEPTVNTLTEYSPTVPISPYGQSKLMAEQVLRDCAKGYGFKTVALRYFNACGADSKVRHGQLKAATHVIARIMETIVNKGVFTLNGTDYPTPDGTCVRDYLHVEDIAEAHYLATKWGEAADKGTSIELNLGSGKGVSITEVINSVERITGRTVLVHKGPARPGDPATLVAYADKAKKTMGWTPANSSIDNIVKTAWSWYNSAEYRGRA